ncbi:winged helix-turn-helix domain-containing protein [Mucilaginibacter flavus]|uniref:winged helix-turn-helix domain-containing protein n=1 Tax=Mucilaginibacter flavus TaxID=931504 RepID=UPI0025B4653E|nr:winged helix-turn-helix domain-containing protein [Mucilaginibacter flavus]MDN3579640.1 winged helix-turn-helix domain-containing protein [Mucilaginibacter flavus]
MNYKAFLNNRVQAFGALIFLLLISAVCAAFSFTDNDDFDKARQEIMLRNIGHQVLLHAGDSTSRVLPVKKIAENEYQLQFENAFAFQSDSLVQIISRSLAKNSVAHNYIVNVLNPSDNGVIFGYAIFSNKKDNIVPCSGRKQPKSRYLIDIKFQKAGISTSQKSMLIAGGIPLLAFIGLVVSRSVKPRKKILPEPEYIDKKHICIGKITFDPQKRQLITGDVTTELTVKENKVLLILAQSPNEIVERSRLQKEIWEDEGVIVGRSLDVFISKLRKKLEYDPMIKLINIHGKGYKLQVEYDLA